MSDNPEHIGRIIEDIVEKSSGNLEPEEKTGSLEETDESGVIQSAGSMKQIGGRRPGAGRPKGTVTTKRKNKLQAKDRFIERVKDNVDTLFNAQLALAKGEQHLFVKYHVGEGKNRKTYVDIVTDMETIKQYLTDYGESLNSESDNEYFYMSTKPANNQAIDSLLNRAFGKAPEKIEIEGGFFKSNQLQIKVINPEEIKEAEVIEGIEVDGTTDSTAQHEAEPSTQSS